MCRFIETIRLENGRFDNLEFHQQRMDDTRKSHFGASFNMNMNLKEILQKTLKENFAVQPAGLFKCRIVYSKQIHEIRFIPYSFPSIQSLQMVKANAIEYASKYENRNELNALFALRKNTDDILIVKNGQITDTSFCNVLFFNGKDWITPEHPLLKGTQRAALLHREKIITASIRPEDLSLFSKIRLINAMIRFEDRLEFPVQNISQIIVEA
jgi:4-amino-4-deoxychorismate lyase